MKILKHLKENWHIYTLVFGAIAFGLNQYIRFTTLEAKAEDIASKMPIVELLVTQQEVLKSQYTDIINRLIRIENRVDKK